MLTLSAILASFGSTATRGLASLLALAALGMAIQRNAGTCPASIAAALRACMPCPAAPPTRELVLADRVSESRAQPGFMVDVKLGSVDARDTLGRIAHVRGIYVRAYAQFTADATNDAVIAYDLRGLFNSVRLEDVTGHPYFPDLDARSIVDDVWFRHWQQIQSPYLHAGTQTGAEAPYGPTLTADYGIAQNVGAGTVTRDVSWYTPLVTLGGVGNPLAGLIPLAALQRQSDQGAFRFRLLTALPGAPAGLTLLGFLNGEGNAGIDVWLDIVYLPVLAVGPAWTLDHYTLPDQNGILRRPDESTEYAAVRFFPEDDPNGDASGRAAAGNIGIWNLDVASKNIMPGLSLVDAMTRQWLYESMERDGANTRANAAQSLPLIDYASLPASWVPQAMILLPYRQRGFGEASGDVSFRWAQFTGDYVRYLHRTVSCNERDRAAKFAQAVDCDPCSRAVMSDAKGNPCSGGTTKGTILIADPKVRGK